MLNVEPIFTCSVFLFTQLVLFAVIFGAESALHILFYKKVFVHSHA